MAKKYTDAEKMALADKMIRRELQIEVASAYRKAKSAFTFAEFVRVIKEAGLQAKVKEFQTKEDFTEEFMAENA